MTTKKIFVYGFAALEGTGIALLTQAVFGPAGFALMLLWCVLKIVSAVWVHQLDREQEKLVKQ